jgi:hypothetical protein
MTVTGQAYETNTYGTSGNSGPCPLLPPCRLDRYLVAEGLQLFLRLALNFLALHPPRVPRPEADATNTLRVTRACQPYFIFEIPIQASKMHAPSSLLPSNSSCSSLDRTTVSSMSLPPTTNDLDDKEKQRLLKQTRKLSQILGELPQKATAQPHLAGCSTPAAEAPSTDASQPHQQHVRFSRHSFIGSRSRSFRLPLPSYSEATSDDMSPLRRPSIRDAPARSSSVRRPSARPSYSNQLDLARFGLGRLRGAESTKTNQSDENTRLAGHSSEVAERLARSSSLRVPKHVYRTLSKGKLRRRSVHNPVIASSQMPPHNSTGISSSTHLQRSVSLWTKRSVTMDESARQQYPTTAQSREDDASGDEHPPLTEAQRIQRIRRGRKLAQVFS